MSRRSNAAESSSKKPSRTSSKSDVLLDISSVVLSTLNDAAAFAPVPALQQAAGIALSIVNAVQAIKSNKEAYAQLAEDVCEVLYIVIGTIQEAGQKGEALSEKLVADLEQVKGKLVPIEAFVEGQLSKNMLMRLLTYKADADTIQEYRSTLKSSLEMFGFRSQIALREATSKITAQQQELLDRLQSQEPSANGSVDPRRLYGSLAGFPPIIATGTVSVTNIAGDYNVSSTKTSIVNNNSGNTYYGNGNSSRHPGYDSPRGLSLIHSASLPNNSDDDDDDDDDERGVGHWKAKIPRNTRTL